MGKAGIILPDYAGRNILMRPSFVKKIATYANHAAYVGWIPETLLHPLEVWEHPHPTIFNPVRRYYLAAYKGTAGRTTHVVIAIAKTNVMINSYKVEALKTANDYRHSLSSKPHIGY